MEKLSTIISVDVDSLQTVRKINEIVDWINAREKGRKGKADMLEKALERLEKAGWKSEKELKEG